MGIANIHIDNTIEEQVAIKWTVIDGDWTYMDTYTYSKAEYDALTPEQLLERQTKQYLDWRNYCENPIG